MNCQKCFSSNQIKKKTKIQKKKNQKEKRDKNRKNLKEKFVRVNLKGNERKKEKEN